MINQKVTQEVIQFCLSHSPNSFLETSAFFPSMVHVLFMSKIPRLQIRDPTQTSWFMVSKSPTLKSDSLQAAAADGLLCSWKLGDLLYCPILEGRARWQTRDQEDFRVAPPRACR